MIFPLVSVSLILTQSTADVVKSALDVDGNCNKNSQCHVELLQRNALAAVRSHQQDDPLGEYHNAIPPRWIMGDYGEDCLTVCQQNMGLTCSNPVMTAEVFRMSYTDAGQTQMKELMETVSGRVCHYSNHDSQELTPFIKKKPGEADENFCQIPQSVYLDGVRHDGPHSYPVHEDNVCSASAEQVERFCWCSAMEEEEKGTCEVYGDPHITGFDRAETNLLSTFASLIKLDPEQTTDVITPGDFWLVKSRDVFIQGRYQMTKESKGSLLMWLAVGGPILKGHKLVIGPTDHGGEVHWFYRDAQGKEQRNTILADVPSFFKKDGLISANYTTESPYIKNTSISGLGIQAELPLGLVLNVNRFPRALAVTISVPKLPGGQDGQCGNFNDNPSDDTAELIMQRMGWRIPDNQVLFSRPMSAYRKKGGEPAKK